MFWVDEHFDAAGADRIKYVLVVSVYGPSRHSAAMRDLVVIGAQHI
jgi:hypothetical protein